MIFYILKPNITFALPIWYLTFTVWTTCNMLQNKTFNTDYTFQAFYILYLIILLNLIIPTLLSLVGGTLTGNGCGSPNHLLYLLFLYYLLLY